MRIFGICLSAVMFGLSSHAWPDPGLASTMGYEPICGLVEEAARVNHLPAAMLTRLIWYESGFQPGAVSRVGAQGVAQFMPTTASEYGLLNPFDPAQAIPRAARLLADLDRRFGNIGLAVAAYNAGPNRVADWLAKTDTLPRQTAVYVLAVTGYSAEDWSGSSTDLIPAFSKSPQTCVALTAILPALQLPESNRRHAHMVRGLEQSGLVLPVLRQSGQLLPEFLRSGRVRTGLE